MSPHVQLIRFDDYASGGPLVTATQHVRRMRGGAQSHLMLGSDGCAYIVKFQNNPQHLRVLANEFLATSLAQAVGLTVPQAVIIDVSQWLVTSTRDLFVERVGGCEPCKAGFQFGSRFVGGLLPGQSLDYLPECRLSEVINKHEFAGMLGMDKWTSNSDGRQAVFHKSLRDKHYMATFIDHGYCFDAAAWTFNDAPLRGVYARNEVYREVTGWDNFEPWLSRIERMEPQTAWNIVEKIPQEWFGSPRVELDMLIDRLFARRKNIRDFIIDFRESSREPFPQWKTDARKKVPSGHSQVIPWRNN